MNKTTIIHFTEQSPPHVRLDVFLVSVFPNFSRSYFKNLIDEKVILVNKKAAKPSLLLQQGDEIAVIFPPEETYDLTPQPVAFEVVDVQKDFVIINKPAGLLVHPVPHDKSAITLVHGLLYAFQDLAGLEDTRRPGIVHRLDKDTSGLMIVARTRGAHVRISAMFKERTIFKTYLALVRGHPPRTGSITHPIGRHPHDGHKMSHQGYRGREAHTDFRTLVYYKDAALVEVKPRTGRTHQIRVHLASIGHGIIGDAVYGSLSKLINRQALHAWQLAFHYDGRDYFYSSTVPDDFKAALRALQEKRVGTKKP